MFLILTTSKTLNKFDQNLSRTQNPQIFDPKSLIEFNSYQTTNQAHKSWTYVYLDSREGDWWLRVAGISPEKESREEVSCLFFF